MKYKRHQTNRHQANNGRRRSRRAGTSLLELVLAMVVAMVVLTLAMGVIRMQGRIQKAHYAKAERMQLARAVLKHVAGDLRHAMSTQEFDATGIPTLPDAASLMSLAASGSTPTGASSVPGVTNGSPTSGSPTTNPGGTNTRNGATSSPSAGPTGSGTPGPTLQGAYQLYGGTSGTNVVGGGGGSGGSNTTPISPNSSASASNAARPASGSAMPSGTTTAGGTATAGSNASASQEPTASGLGSDATMIYFRGTADRLEFDASRLPRIDEYEGFGFDNGSGGGDASLHDITSDVKTVTYYVGSIEDVGEAAEMTFGEQEFSVDDGEEEQATGLIRSEVDRSASLYATLESNGNQLDKAAEIVAPEVSAVAFRYYDGYEWWEEWDSDALGGIPTAVEIDLTLRGEAEDEDGTHYMLVVRLPASQRVALEEAELAKQQESMPGAEAAAAGSQASGTPAAGTMPGAATSGMMGAPGFGTPGATPQAGFGAPGGQGPGGQGPGGQGPGGQGGRGGQGRGGRGGGGGQNGGFGGGRGGQGGGGQGGGGRGGGGGFPGGGGGGGGFGGGGMGGGGMGGAGMGGGGFGGARGGGS